MSLLSVSLPLVLLVTFGTNSTTCAPLVFRTIDLQTQKLLLENVLCMCLCKFIFYAHFFGACSSIVWGTRYSLFILLTVQSALSATSSLLPPLFFPLSSPARPPSSSLYRPVSPDPGASLLPTLHWHTQTQAQESWTGEQTDWNRRCPENLLQT